MLKKEENALDSSTRSVNRNSSAVIGVLLHHRAVKAVSGNKETSYKSQGSYWDLSSPRKTSELGGDRGLESSSSDHFCSVDKMNRCSV